MDLFAPSLSISPAIPFATPSGERVDQVPAVGAPWAALADTASWEGDVASPQPPSPLGRGDGKADDGSGTAGGVPSGAGFRDHGGRQGLDKTPHGEEAAAGHAAVAAGGNAEERDVEADLPLTVQDTGVVLPTIPPLMQLSLGPSADSRQRRRPPSQLPGGEGGATGEAAGDGPLAAAAAAFFARSGTEEEVAMPADMDVDPPPSLLFPSMPSTPTALVSPAASTGAPVLATPPAIVLATTLSAASDCNGGSAQLTDCDAAETAAAADAPATAVWALSGRKAGVGNTTTTAPASQCSSSVTSDGHLHLSAVTSEATDSASPSDEESISSQVLLAQAKKRKLRPPSPTPPTDDRGGLGGAHRGPEGCRYCGVPPTATATISTLTAELSAARTSSTQLDKRLAFAHEENRALRRRLTSLTADHHAASARVTQLTSALTAAQQQLASAAAAAASYTPPAGWSAPGASARAGGKRKQASMFSLTFVAVLVVFAAVNRLSPSSRQPADTRLVLSAGAGAGAGAPSVGSSPPGPLALPYASSSMLRKESPPSKEWAPVTHRALPPSSAEAAAGVGVDESVPTVSAPAMESSSSSYAAAAAIPASVRQTAEPVVADTPAPPREMAAVGRPESTESAGVGASPVSGDAHASAGSVAVASPSSYSYVLCRDALAAIRSVRRCAAARARGDVCDRCGHSDVVASQTPPEAAAAAGRATHLSHSVRAQAMVVGTPPPRVPVRDAGGGNQWQVDVPAGAPRELGASVIGGGRDGGVRPAGVAATPVPLQQADAPALGPILHVGVEDVDDGSLSLLLPAAGLGLDGPRGGEEADGALAEVICRVTDVRRFVPPAPGPAAVRAPGVHSARSGMW